MKETSVKSCGTSSVAWGLMSMALAYMHVTDLHMHGCMGLGLYEILVHMHGCNKPRWDRSKLVSNITQVSRHSKCEAKILIGQHL